MLKRYQIELDRNERDFATFLRSREVTLSKNEFRILIATQGIKDQVSLFEKYDRKNHLRERNSNKDLWLAGKTNIKKSFYTI